MASLRRAISLADFNARSPRTNKGMPGKTGEHTRRRRQTITENALTSATPRAPLPAWSPAVFIESGFISNLFVGKSHRENLVATRCRTPDLFPRTLSPRNVDPQVFPQVDYQMVARQPPLSAKAFQPLCCSRVVLVYVDWRLWFDHYSYEPLTPHGS